MTAMPYELWDCETANMIGEYATEAEARKAHAEIGDPYVMVVRVTSRRPKFEVIVPAQAPPERVSA